MAKLPQVESAATSINTGVGGTESNEMVVEHMRKFKVFVKQVTGDIEGLRFCYQCTHKDGSTFYTSVNPVNDAVPANTPNFFFNLEIAPCEKIRLVVHTASISASTADIKIMGEV